MSIHIKATVESSRELAIHEEAVSDSQPHSRYTVRITDPTGFSSDSSYNNMETAQVEVNLLADHQAKYWLGYRFDLYDNVLTGHPPVWSRPVTAGLVEQGACEEIAHRCDYGDCGNLALTGEEICEDCENAEFYGVRKADRLRREKNQAARLAGHGLPNLIEPAKSPLFCSKCQNRYATGSDELCNTCRGYSPANRAADHTAVFGF